MHYKSEPVNVFRKIITLYCVDRKKKPSNTPIECKIPSVGANALGKYSDCGVQFIFKQYLVDVRNLWG